MRIKEKQNYGTSKIILLTIFSANGLGSVYLSMKTLERNYFSSITTFGLINKKVFLQISMSCAGWVSGGERGFLL